ncbi:MAG: hypothetical protein CMF72_03345 [Mameliella sp.]|nr:hypothetical protein [Mameliella sp.]|tara:strand:- start:1679 stop:2725 length:1047 start_codon:yes stop_codon:yes gene_type:complete
MSTPQTDQSELRCPSCGGQCVYDPNVQMLKCTSCGTTQGLESPWDSAASAETDYRADTPETLPPDLPDMRAHRCETCGGEVVFTGASLSDRCPYCDGAVVLSTTDHGYRTTALIPFRVPEQAAQTHALDWVKGRIAAPRGLSETVGKGRVAGLYAPFWTFDSQEAVDYWASYTTGSGKNRRKRRTSGTMKIGFDDLLMPASPHVTPLIRDGILHQFDPRRLRPYRAGYLAGFAAERHHQSVGEGLGANEADKRLLIRNHIKANIGKSGVSNITFKTDTTGIRYRRILLPVWILHYRWKDKPMKVVVSGLDGRTFGERPFCPRKLTYYAAAASLAVIAFGLLWGAGAAP